MNVPGHSRPIILCIDDEETALELRKRVLETAGCTVLTATNAHEALEIFRSNHVDLVLTEHVHPTLGGGPLVKAMKALKPDVPIGIYSADRAVFPEDIPFADLFITKLVSVDELLRTVEELLTNRPGSAAA
jgi:two-component system, OmpR family, response regulator CpxR